MSVVRLHAGSLCRLFFPLSFPSLTVCLMFVVNVARDIAALFSVLSRYSSCHLSVAAVLCEGYLAAISGFIFALSFGLSQRCCPPVIVRHDQGGDLSF